MFLMYGQFWNQTKQQWDWQQIGGSALSEMDANAYCEGFAIHYGMTTKVVGRYGTRMYLPPVQPANPLVWPEIRADMVEHPH